MSKILLIPLIIGFGAQVIKILLYSRSMKDAVKQLFSYGGMPSSHTAFVVSITTIIYLDSGWQSPLFALSLIFALLIIRDAVGLRQTLSQHSHILQRLQLLIPENERINIPPLAERMGHTPAQALVGGIWGLIGSLILWSIF